MVKKPEGKKEDSNSKQAMINIGLAYLRRTKPHVLLLHMICFIIANIVVTFSYVMIFHFPSIVSLCAGPSEPSGISLSARQQIEVDSALGNFLRETGANRVSLHRYHAPTEAPQGIPFVSQTMTNEVITSGNNRILPLQRSIPIFTTPLLNARLAENNCMVASLSREVPNSRVHWYFVTFNGQSIIRCPIYQPNGNILGFISVDWINEVANLDSWESITKAEAARLSLILSRR